MRMRRVATIMTIAAFSAPLAAQQHHHQPSQAKPGQGGMGDMAAMHCGGGMPMTQGMSGQQQMMTHGDSAKGGMMSGMMAGMMDMMGPPGPALILGHTAQLGLSATQVTRLEALQKEAQPACAEHMRLGMTAVQEANKLLDAASPDWSAYAAKLSAATTHMAEGLVVMARAAVSARDVLTPAQRQTLKERTAQMHRQP